MIKRQLGFSLNPRQIAMLDAEKAKTGASRAEIVRRAINSYMRKARGEKEAQGEDVNAHLQNMAAGEFLQPGAIHRLAQLKAEKEEVANG
jgi:metal-responsive CopG/Arc/MetJ family transcriptional regulator